MTGAGGGGQDDDVQIAQVAQRLVNAQELLYQQHGNIVGTHSSNGKVNHLHNRRVVPHSHTDIDTGKQQAHSRSFSSNNQAQQFEASGDEDQVDTNRITGKAVEKLIQIK